MDISTGKNNTLNWFEIPVTDMPRARKFYETIFDMKMEEMVMGPVTMAMFPGEPGNGKVGGALCLGEWYKPATSGGPFIYLNGNPDLGEVLSRVEAAGGKITLPKTQIAEDIGYMGMFVDSEGNTMALHSNK
jgi:predicted enzyme related to lactoylglutathione lyase